MKPTVLIVSFLVMVLRPVFLFVEINQHLSQGYQAIAHLLVGGLFAAWWVGGEKWSKDWKFEVAANLSLVEGVCFIATVFLL